MNTAHTYTLALQWTGNTGEGTAHYRSYKRTHTVEIAHKAPMLCSSDTAFRGDADLYNPEDLLVASIAGCHMLWYLHLCADKGVLVTTYSDQPVGTLLIDAQGVGRFSEVHLDPKVKVADASMITQALELHQQAHHFCFIANSCNFPVLHHPSCTS